ncbi:MAG: GTPase HflX [Eubacteriales bacterium]|nr:GTPase HflX [Eubacteriales bacterium]
MYKTIGNLEGMRKTAILELDALFDTVATSHEFVSEEILECICKISADYNREISIYIARNGSVQSICVGNNSSVNLQALSMRRGTDRLCALRCIHTHPSGSPMLSGMDTSALCSLKLDAMSAVGVVDGKPGHMQTAVVAPFAEDGFRLLPLCSASNIPHDDYLAAILEAEKEVDSLDANGEPEKERVLLLGIDDESSLVELRALAKTANVEVIEKVLQKRPKPDTASYIGEGKAEEVARLVQQNNIDTVICDDEISGSMQKRLENYLGCRVIDRTTLILDIFAKHSRSAESKLQVEAAQLKYRSQRLTGLGQELSRLGGGIGTRGPGESKLEVDRRRIQQRLAFLEKEIEKIAAQRNLRRKEREKNELPVVALVGYTNAGKSSLLNALTGANAYVEDKLFATLDALTRKLKLNDGQEILLVDTVGFIKKLPHFLVKTFASTLEEASLADVIVIVLDGSNEEVDSHYATVCKTLEEIGATTQARVLVVNKADKIEQKDFAEGIYISAKFKQDLEKLQNAISDALKERYCTATYNIPYAQMGLLPMIHENGKVYEEEYTDIGVIVRANLPNTIAKKLCLIHNINVIKH